MTVLQDKLTHKPDEVAPLLGLGRNSVYALIRSGALRSIRVGRKILIPASAITDFLNGEKN
ncbi:helix-turn-helix domain-containing protein [Deinococcus altitudinis]|uniref:helix-turn-helix domain-containing protein n=1 Tax=Deinococcus altitudinis TaxID=468914 RepID=UPI0038923257